MTSGKLGVGVELEERASLDGAQMRPMWPFMERDFSSCFDEFLAHWSSLVSRDYPTAEHLFFEVVRSAWSSGSPYWMKLAANWLVQAVDSGNMDPSILRETRRQMIDSEILGKGLRSAMRQRF